MYWHFPRATGSGVYRWVLDQGIQRAEEAAVKTNRNGMNRRGRQLDNSLQALCSQVAIEMTMLSTPPC